MGNNPITPGLGWADRFDDYDSVIGQYPGNPLSSKQFVTVFHSSDYMRPSPTGLPRSAGKGSDEGVVFAGTKRAADRMSDTKSRPWVHELRIPTSAIDPLLFADDNVVPNLDDGPYGQINMFEEIPINTREVAKSGRVGIYRNAVEDRGSTSFVIPKSLFDKGVVEHVGVHPSQFHKEYLVNKDGSPDIEGWQHVSETRKRREEKDIHPYGPPT